MANDRPAGTAVEGTTGTERGDESGLTARVGEARSQPVESGRRESEPVESGPGQSEPAASASHQVAPKKRGRETAGDMLRSLGLVLIIVVALWFFAQPPASDEQAIRVVDPSSAVAAFAADVPAAPVPEGLPEQWRPTSATVLDALSGLRIGYVTPGGRYAEYAASTLPEGEYVPQITGPGATRLGQVEIDGLDWEQYRDGDGSLSLVRSYGPVVVAVGTLRSSATLDELETLVGALETR